ncbi:hypothetical protein PILCRDRAFT_670038 [Piloderma croceum F 1598]|uniref:Uncharacterized protein n=1 Tax=Piloderma croceum (strain F 1598) TaxID=765440 RepID=A0A0C3F6C9_PILCF|nr:hypothetical protein PILCRDRAFT_670038 [Piloderma croceum F 1598]
MASLYEQLYYLLITFADHNTRPLSIELSIHSPHHTHKIPMNNARLQIFNHIKRALNSYDVDTTSLKIAKNILHGRNRTSGKKPLTPVL